MRFMSYLVAAAYFFGMILIGRNVPDASNSWQMMLYATVGSMAAFILFLMARHWDTRDRDDDYPDRD